MRRDLIQILGVNIDNVSLQEALDRAGTLIQSGGFHHVVTPGPEFLLEANHHPKFCEILNRADLSLPDGIGLQIASRVHGRGLKQRVTGVDFVQGLIEQASRRNWRVFLFGGGHHVADKAALTMMQQHPGLQIVGTESGRRGLWRLHDRRIVERINASGAEILLVALGAPKQELWIDRHRAQLPHVCLAVGVGRTFDYYAGTIPRAPKLLRRFGLEWADTYLRADRYYDSGYRRQRVRNATWHFMKTILQDRFHVRHP